jgi:Ca2+-binding EF-hand superfamily protein
MIKYSEESDFTKLVMIVAQKFVYNENIKEMNSIFEMINQDHTGLITTEELDVVFKSKFIKCEQEKVEILVQNISFFHKTKVTYSELLACCIYPHEKHIVTKEILWMTFKYLCQIGKGYITHQSI